ncbi:MAG: hypothetical protein P8N51_04840, partial [Pseudomonadales bacterium]|nr:hypothetical protein [Pseudomonadales bacterium]
PGSGATTTAEALARRLGVACFDSDDFFHKPSDPPFVEQYSKDERNQRIIDVVQSHDAWILSGSVCSWELSDLNFTHAVLLNVGASLRLNRLMPRERQRFGDRIDPGGDMHEENTGFMKWAASYETGELAGRSLPTERGFIDKYCAALLEIKEERPVDDLVDVIAEFLKTQAPA